MFILKFRKKLFPGSYLWKLISYFISIVSLITTIKKSFLNLFHKAQLNWTPKAPNLSSLSMNENFLWYKGIFAYTIGYILLFINWSTSSLAKEKMLLYFKS